jgi:hypothetical protein
VYAPFGAVAESGTEGTVAFPSPVAGTISQLNVRMLAAPGSGGGGSASDNYVFNVRKNGANTGVTCTITGQTAVTCSDLVNTVAVAVGDTIALQAVPGSSPNQEPSIAWSVKVG